MSDGQIVVIEIDDDHNVRHRAYDREQLAEAAKGSELVRVLNADVERGVEQMRKGLERE